MTCNLAHEALHNDRSYFDATTGVDRRILDAFTGSLGANASNDNRTLALGSALTAAQSSGLRCWCKSRAQGAFRCLSGP